MPNSVTLRANLDSAPKPTHQRWRRCVGSGHALQTLRTDWQAHKDVGVRYVLFHGGLDNNKGKLSCPNEPPPYCFFHTNRISDFLLAHCVERDGFDEVPQWTLS